MSNQPTNYQQGSKYSGNRFLKLILHGAWFTLFVACTIVPEQAPIDMLQPGMEFAVTQTSTPFQAFLPGLLADENTIPLIGSGITEQATSSPSPTEQTENLSSISLWIEPGLPALLRNQVNLPGGVIECASASETASLRLEVSPERPVTHWVYALVTPFPSLVDGVKSDVLRRFWGGEAVGPFNGRPLLLDDSTRYVLSSLWGEPSGPAILVLPTQEILDYAWKNRPSWAIIPFEQIEPGWKVMQIDGQSPLQKQFDLTAYTLTAPVSLLGDPLLVEAVVPVYGTTLAPATNRAPERLTVLAITGVTALVRSTAYAMEQRGITYPAKDIAGWLREADITHVSNEVPFAEGCPFPDPFQIGVQFCSDPRYIELLQTIGTDIVELTGDHFQDWGEAAMNLTLELYRQQGWSYFGGGINSEEAQKALLVEHNGTKLAFIGCNAKGGSFAQAGPNRPGAMPCGFDFMESEIIRLRAAGYLPVATFQHFEYYTYKAQPDQQRDFRRMANAGAVIVSGSQAHQPQALELLNGSIIHYGLGNLFFDQYEVSLATRQAFIDRHVFYDGRYLGMELLSMMFVDYARARPMTSSERLDLLKAIYSASGW